MRAPPAKPMKEPAPIVIFAFNRPDHLRRTLEALARNPLADRSRLIAFSDGARPARAGEAERVAAVRAVLRERAWCGEVEIVEAPENCGLAKSIRSGVSKVLESAERVIVLEDDQETSPGFLTYLNEALERYENEPRVMAVSAYLPALREAGQLPQTFFLPTATSSGWATWRRAWAQQEPEARVLARRIRESGRKREFNLDGAYNFYRQLQLNITGQIRTWAVQWYASIFVNHGLTLYPHRSLVRNFGHDGSGTHCQPNLIHHQPALAESVPVETIPVEMHAAAREALRRHLCPPFGRRVANRIREAWEDGTRAVRRLRKFSLRALWQKKTAT